MTSVSWREDLADAWSIVEFANNEQEFQYMAQSMEGLCGLKLDHRSPKRAVDEFFERYTGKAAGDHQDRYYRHEQQDWLYVAELVTPSFYNKVFRGQAESSAEKAEVSVILLPSQRLTPPGQLVDVSPRTQMSWMHAGSCRRPSIK